MDLQPLLDEDKAAPLVGVTPKTLANWRTQGKGPKWIRCGRLVRYHPADLSAHNEANRVASTSEVR